MIVLAWRVIIGWKKTENVNAVETKLSQDKKTHCVFEKDYVEPTPFAGFQDIPEGPSPTGEKERKQLNR